MTDITNYFSEIELVLISTRLMIPRIFFRIDRFISQFRNIIMGDDILYKVALHFVEDQKSKKYLACGMILS